MSNAGKLPSVVAKLAALRRAAMTEKPGGIYLPTGGYLAKLGTPGVGSNGPIWALIALGPPPAM